MLSPGIEISLILFSPFMFFLYVTIDPGYPSRVTGNIDIIQHIDIVSENSILNILTLRQNMTF